MKRNVALLLTVGCLVLSSSPSVCATPAQQAPQSAAKEMSDQERAIAWKGERVRLLPNEPWFTQQEYIGGDGTCIRLSLPVEQHAGRRSLPVEQYAGREGTVVEAEASEFTIQRVVIELEGTSERIVASCHFEALGFHSEFERARQLVGKVLWSKGELQLTPPEEYSKDVGHRTGIETHNIEPLTVTRIDWGYSGRPVLLCMTNATGQGGCLLSAGQRHVREQYFFDPRFEIGSMASYTEFLHTEDPRKRFPAWRAEVWKFIESGTVAIGMTEEMARLACGFPMIAVGAETDSAGNAGTIYVCRGSGPRFLITKGRVVKYPSR